jgi:hypothetical protein
MRYLAIILLFASCSTYKAYQKVAADPFVDAKESVLLAQKCLAVYPFKSSDSAKIVKVSDDSAAYDATIRALLGIIDTLTAQLEPGEVGFIDTNDIYGPDLRSPRVRQQDSLRILRRFIKNYRLPPVIRTVEKEVPVVDGPKMALMQSNLIACQADNAKLLESEVKATDKLGKKQQREGWIIAGGLLLAVIAYGTGRLTRKV